MRPQTDKNWASNAQFSPWGKVIMPAYHTDWCVTWSVTPSFFGTHGSFATRTRFSLSLIHPPPFLPPSSTYPSPSLIHLLLSLPHLPTSLSPSSTSLSLIYPLPSLSYLPLSQATQEYRIVHHFFSLSSSTPISGHSGILSGLTTLEHRVVNESFSVLISTLAGGLPGTLGGLITLEHRVIVAPILLSFLPLLEATQEYWWSNHSEIQGDCSSYPTHFHPCWRPPRNTGWLQSLSYSHFYPCWRLPRNTG